MWDAMRQAFSRSTCNFQPWIISTTGLNPVLAVKLSLVGTLTEFETKSSKKQKRGRRKQNHTLVACIHTFSCLQHGKARPAASSIPQFTSPRFPNGG